VRFLYPSAPFQPRQPDDNFASEYASTISAGFLVSLFSYEEFCAGNFHPEPVPARGERVCYRGWMLTVPDYQRLTESLARLGGVPLTSAAEYKLCHYLPSWYSLLVEHTPKTLFFVETANVAAALQGKGWTGCFLKDYVKSLSTDGGSLVTSLDKIPEVIRKMKKYRGMIEGGLCAREIEDFVPATEQRHFVFKGKAYSVSGEVPDLVSLAAKAIKSPFFSVDTVQRQDGSLRIVELGDGQVSDRKNWSPEQFLQLFK